MALLDDGTVIIHDGNAHLWMVPWIDGEAKGHGLIPRDYSTHPQGYYATIPALAPDFPLIPDDQIDQWIADKDAQRSWLKDIRMTNGPNGGPIPSRDQNGKGYCWQHGPVSAMLLYRALMHAPYADLSAYACACRDKNYADQGGWGGEGMDNIANWGCPTSQFWPQRSMSRQNDNPHTWADAAKYKVLAQFADLSAAQYDRTMSWAQQQTLALCDMPTADDFNDWSHCVCGCFLASGANHRHETRDATSGKLLQLADFDRVWDMNNPLTKGRGKGHWNSWGDSYGNLGMGIRTGNRAVADGCVGIMRVTA